MEDQEPYEVAWKVEPTKKKPTNTQLIATLKKKIAKQNKVIKTLWDYRNTQQTKNNADRN